MATNLVVTSGVLVLVFTAGGLAGMLLAALLHMAGSARPPDGRREYGD